MSFYYIFSVLSNHMDIYDRLYEDNTFLCTVFKRELIDFIRVLWFESGNHPKGIS